VNAVSVEVSSGPVVVLGGAWVGVTSEDLSITEWDARVEGVGNGGVPPMRPSMCAKRKNPRTACIIVLTEEGISPHSPRCGM
jgi:hypothetical protein